MARKKITAKNELTVNPFKLDFVQVEELRVKLAKRANQRLVRLERAELGTGETLADLSTAQYAYEQIALIRKQAAAAGGQKVKTSSQRFRETKVKDAMSARRELFALQSFLGQSMSRVAPAMKSINKTSKWFLERGISIASYKSFYNFLNSRAFEELKKAGLSSDDLIEYYTKAHESGKSFAEVNKLISEYIKENSKGEVSTITAKGLAEKLGVKVIRESGTWRDK